MDNEINSTNERQDALQDTRQDAKTAVSFEEKQALILEEQNSEGISFGAIFLVYGVFFAILLIFIPKIYLANNVYFASKNINYLRAQKEALQDESLELQQHLENLKFNFLTLEIEEIK